MSKLSELLAKAKANTAAMQIAQIHPSQSSHSSKGEAGHHAILNTNQSN